MQTKLEGVSVKEAQRKLLTYTALDNRVRLEAFLFIAEHPGVPFKEIVKKVTAKDTLVAYHLGVLKTADLVNFTYERKGRASYSKYNLTPLGVQVHHELSMHIETKHNRA
jgi:predicted transcriptional regulator